MAPIEGLNEDFRDILLALADEEVEFVLVGAFALAFHGVPRATGDIDVLVRPSAENAARVHAALAAFGAPLASAGVAVDDFAREGTVYQVGVPPRRIDILTQISGVTFDEAWATHEDAVIDGRPVAVIGRAALLRNKRASGRPKDIADASQLEP